MSRPHPDLGDFGLCNTCRFATEMKRHTAICDAPDVIAAQLAISDALEALGQDKASLPVTRMMSTRVMVSIEPVLDCAGFKPRTPALDPTRLAQFLGTNVVPLHAGARLDDVELDRPTDTTPAPLEAPAHPGAPGEPS